MKDNLSATQVATQGAVEAQGNAGNAFGAFVPFLLIFVIFYFLIIRPQQKREAQKKEKLNQIKRGDKIVTNGGVVATVSKVVDDKRLLVEISSGVEVEIFKGFIADILEKKGALSTQSTSAQSKKNGRQDKSKSSPKKSSSEESEDKKSDDVNSEEKK